MTSGEVSQRREAVLVQVLRAMVALAAVTAVVQVVSMTTSGRAEVLPWIGVDALVGLAFLALLRAARAGRQRVAAAALVAVFGLMAVLLLVSDGADHPMWAMLTVFTLALSLLVLGARGGLVTLGAAAVVLLPIVVLQDTNVLHPVWTSDEGSGESANAVEMLLLLAVLGYVFRVYSRDVQMVAVAPVPIPVPAPVPVQERTLVLTPREVEVVRLIAEGQSNDAIAARLVVSPRTVHTHVTNAMRKCGCTNRTELGVLAVREGLVPLSPRGPGLSTARTP